MGYRVDWPRYLTLRGVLMKNVAKENHHHSFFHFFYQHTSILVHCFYCTDNIIHLVTQILIPELFDHLEFELTVSRVFLS